MGGKVDVLIGHTIDGITYLLNRTVELSIAQ